MSIIIAFWTFVVVCIGLITGSFLGACIYRIPNDLSIAFPERSFCPNCKHQLAWKHNIPVISWLLLRGKCAYCKAAISTRYPIVELITTIVALLSYQHFGLTLTAAVVFVFCCSLIVASFIDLDHMIIPNVITFPGLIISIILVTINYFYGVFSPPIVNSFGAAFWGFMCGAGFLYFVAYAYLWIKKRDGLGMGDIKQLAYTGVLLGPQAALFTVFVGSILGTLFVVAQYILFRRDISKHFPFGPYLSLATIIFVFLDARYLKYFF